MAARKKSLEQFAAGLDLEVRSVPLDAIDFDPQNPNEIPADMYEQLKADIRDYGFWQPILVTPVAGDRWRMIDGEHRARIVGELGGLTIPAVIADEMSADEARFRLLTMNRFRGDFVPMRMADMLSSLAETQSDAHIRQRLGMDDAELKGMLELTRFTDDPGEGLQAAIDKERLEAPTVLRFVVGKRDGELIDRVIAAAAGAKLDRGKALAAVCKDWEKAHKTKAKEESAA